MLEWTTAGRARFGLIVHHDDAEREWAYDRESHIGRLRRGLDEAAKKEGWTVVSMKDDWKTVFPSEITAIDILLEPDATMLKCSAREPRSIARPSSHTYRRSCRRIPARTSIRTSAPASPTAYLDKMLAEPFEPFTFSPAGAAVYQLGPFGTAAKKLKEWDLKR
jgi:hypothetical protein